MFNSVRQKIIIAQVATVLLAMVLFAVLFFTMLRDLYETTNRQQITHTLERLQQEIIEHKLDVSLFAQEVTQRDALREAVTFLARYQNIQKYNRQTISAKKDQLLEMLEYHFSSSTLDELIIYDVTGRPLVLLLRQQGLLVGGYYEYEQGKPIWSNRYAKIDAIKPFVDFHAIHASVTQAATEKFRFGISNFSPYMTITHKAVIADADDGGYGGMLHASFYINDTFMQQVERNSNGVQLHSFINDKLVVGGHEESGLQQQLQQVIQQQSHIPLAMIDTLLGEEEPLIISLDNQMMGSLLRVPLGQEYGYFAITFTNVLLQQNIRAFAIAEIIDLLVVLLLVIPLGIYLTRQWITKPIDEIAMFARNLSRGKYAIMRNYKGDREFSTLVDAFNTMSSAIMDNERILRDKQKELESIINNSPAIIYIKELNGTYATVNPAFRKFFQIGGIDVCGKTDMDIFDKQHDYLISENDLRLLLDRRPQNFEEVYMYNGDEHSFYTIKFPIYNDDDVPYAICSISIDISERKKAEAELLLSKKIVENANEAILVTDANTHIIDINQAYERITGYSRSEVIGKKPSISNSGYHDKEFYKQMWQDVLEKGLWKGEIWDRRKNGEIYPKWLSISTVRNDNNEPINYVGIFSDITEEKSTREQLNRLAYYDALTGLANRQSFQEHLIKELERDNHHKYQSALLFLDLDHFKNINDTLGHTSGDELLKLVAKRLSAVVREGDLVSRLGGDEFTIVMSEIETIYQVTQLAQAVIETFAKPFALSSAEVHVGASIGISMYPNDAVESQTLIKNADMALYKAKDCGRNNFQFYSKDLQDDLMRRIQLEEELHIAYNEQQFELYYQPKLDLQSGKISSVESLIRWNHPKRGLVPPASFIPFLEESGLIIKVGEWIMQQAARDVQEFSRQLGYPIQIAVNLSAVQFRDIGLISQVERILGNLQLDPACFELEITESMVMEDIDMVIRKLHDLRKLGLSLAIDDFGTGYSSLNYLKEFPINSLKIDQSFIRDMRLEGADAAIVKAIISMAISLNLQVVAEGVENQQQLDFLQQHQCSKIQGYHISKPQPFAQMVAFIRNYNNQ